jgi:hypothetical protein
LDNSIKELHITITKPNKKLKDLEERPMKKCDESNLFNDSNLDKTIENLETSVKELKKVLLNVRNVNLQLNQIMD